jgi:ABC-type nickel/cobalt efflux system permease component RcnA
VDVPAGQVLTREQDRAFAGSSGLREQVREGLQVRQDGRACPGELAPAGSVVTEGLTMRFRCPEPVSGIRLRIALLHDVDGRYRTLTAIAGPGEVDRRMFTSAVPEHDVEVDPTKSLLPGGAQSTEDVRGAFGGSLPFERRFVTALDTSPGVLGFGLALLVAFVVGAAHALAPGHGKAIGAAYLVGDRGRPRDAVVLGVTVALMHTGSVIVLGLALWSAARQPDAARLTTGITLASGVLLTAIGGWLLTRRLREPRAHAHPHVVPDKPLSREGLIALGAAGGLLPSPSALLLLLTALAVGRVEAGLALIAAFSAGLALTLTVVGLAVLRGRDVAHDRGGRLHDWAHRAPTLGAAVVLGLGLTIVVRALA